MELQIHAFLTLALYSDEWSASSCTIKICQSPVDSRLGGPWISTDAFKMRKISSLQGSYH